MTAPVVAAFALAALAASATLVGGLVGVGRRVRGGGGLAAALAFAAGAMLVVSVAEIVPKGVAALRPLAGPGALVAVVALALGAALAVWVLQRVASQRPPGAGEARVPATEVERRRVLRSGTVVAVAVTAHNVPEGLLTFVAAVDDLSSGVLIAAAIALHNVPEGVAVAAPIYGATGSRTRALATAAVSGAAELLGAVLGALLLATTLPEALFGTVFAVVAGVMVQVGLGELLPTALRLAGLRVVTLAVGAGGGAMGLSLLLLAR